MGERVVLEVGGDVDALALAEAYASLVAAGSGGELVVRLGAGGAPPPARIDLVPEGGDWYALPFAVTIESAGAPLALRGVPVRVAARAVQLSGLAFPALTAEGLQVVADERVTLSRCGVSAAAGEAGGVRPAAWLRLAGTGGEVRMESCVLRTAGADALSVAVVTPGPELLDVELLGCALGAGLVLEAGGARRLTLRECSCADPGETVRCAPGAVEVVSPRSDPPPETAPLASLL